MAGIRRQAACTWIVSDAWFNLPAHPTGVQGHLPAVVGEQRPQGEQNVDALALSDKASYKRWVVEHLEGVSPHR